MEKAINKLLIGVTLIALIILSLSFVSASVIISSVDQGDLYPGQETNIDITIENNLDYDIEDVSLSLDFYSADASKPSLFSSVGSSEKSVEEIREDKSKTLSFDVKSSSSIAPGDYNIQYTLKYTDENNTIKTSTGRIGIKVSSKTKLDFSVSTETPVVNQKGKIIFKITNKGYGDIKFVSFQISSQGYTLLSEDKVYIGTVGSDDTESASFDVLFKNNMASLQGTLTYVDFDNNEKIESINLPITIYSKEEALKLGIIKANNSWIYILVIIIIIVLIIIIRMVRKRNRLKRSKEKYSNSKENSGGY